MKTIKINAPGIPQQNKIVIAKNQPEYNQLNAVIELNEARTQVTYSMAFEFDFHEIFKLLQTRRIWYQRIVQLPSKDPVIALENEGKFQPLGVGMDNPLPDTSDDLLTIPAVPVEMLAMIEKYHTLRSKNPDIKDKIENRGQEMADALSALFRALELVDVNEEPARASELLFAISLAALRMSRLTQLLGNDK